MDKPKTTTIQWGQDSRWVVTVKLFVTAIEEADSGVALRAVTHLARHLDIWEDVIFELGEQSLGRRLKELPIAAEPEGDPLDAAGDEGEGVARTEPPDPAGHPRTCEWCVHHTPQGVCRNAKSTRENEITAVGDTCSECALTVAPMAPVNVDARRKPRVICSECETIRSSKNIDGVLYPYTHNNSPGHHCPGCHMPGLPVK